MARPFSVEDSVRLKQVGDAQISPDGQTVAFVTGNGFIESGPARTKLPATDIYAISDAASEPIRLTRSPRSGTTPRWSPDGLYLAFYSDREEDGQRQVYLLPANGGEATQLTSVRGTLPSPRSLNPLKWFSDGKSLAFQMIDALSEDESEAREAGRDAIEFETGHQFTRIWRVGVDGGEPECISPDNMQVWEFAISPDGNRIAAVVSEMPYEWDWYRCRLAIFDIGSSHAVTVVDTPRQVAKPVWSPDGSLIAYLTSNWSDRGSDSGDVMVVSPDGGESRNLTEGSDSSFDSIQWPGEFLISTANIAGGSGIAILNADGGRPEWLWRSESWLKGMTINTTGDAGAVITDPDGPSEVYTGRVSGSSLELRRRTSLHPGFDEITVGKMSAIRWTAPDGQEIGGYLVVPQDSDADAPLPTVALIHGGPASAVRGGLDDGRRWAHLLAANGFAVYLPNYRGSTGRGLAWTESNIGDMGGADFADMMAGLDALIEQGIADPSRLGITGWSYGGFTTAWAVTQTDRFKAAIMGAGISDWRSFHGRSYLHSWDVIHYGGSDPYDPESPHARFSPINYIRNVKTPTLILHGEEDWDVPVEQSYQFYRALKDLGVETELVVYPREPHGPVEYEHLIDIGDRLVNWFKAKLS
ncbi:MAG: S9 family peptidase [Chloroflexi bacterium]|nr:S9 family peptidase [Chloroflexota bacterium]